MAKNKVQTADVAIEESGISETKGFKEFFTPSQQLLWCGFLVVGLLMRWLELDVRALHHDESLHAMWAKYYFDLPFDRFYKYDPMLHGPFLYNTLVFMIFSFGETVFAMRLPCAFLGSVGILLPFVFRRYFSSTAVLLLTGVVALSPTLTYWSRFIRHDYFALLGLFLSVWGITCASAKTRYYFLFGGLALQFCAKENSYVHVAIVIGYIFFEMAFVSLFMGRPPWSLNALFMEVKKRWAQILLGLLLMVLVYCLFFSAGFMYLEGILDGLYRKSIMYWWEQSAEERIKGPFLFHFYVLGFYETLFMAVFFLHAGLFYKDAPLWAKIVAFVSVLGTLVVFCVLKLGLEEGKSVEEMLMSKPLLHIFKPKNMLDVPGIILLPIHSVLVTVIHLLRSQRQLAITGYLFTATFFTYSYLGEKVPWLSLYPLISGIIYFTLFFDKLFHEKPMKGYREYPLSTIFLWIGGALMLLGFIILLQEGPRRLDNPRLGYMQSMNHWIVFSISGAVFLIIGALDVGKELFPRVNLLIFVFTAAFLFNFRDSYLTNFVYSGHARELLSQVHTAPECLEVANMIRGEIVSQRRGYAPHIFVEGDAIWPLTWYFRGLPTYSYTANDKEKDGFLYRIANFKSDSDEPPAGYRKRRFNLRGWWVPDYSQMTVRRFLHYAVNHEPWNGVGYAYANLYYRLTEEGEPLKHTDDGVTLEEIRTLKKSFLELEKKIASLAS